MGGRWKVVDEYRDQAILYGLQTNEVLEKLQNELSGRYLLSLHIIFHLYQMVFDKIDVAKGTFTKEELNPTASEIREKVMEVTSAFYA